MAHLGQFFQVCCSIICLNLSQKIPFFWFIYLFILLYIYMYFALENFYFEVCFNLKEFLYTTKNHPKHHHT